MKVLLLILILWSQPSLAEPICQNDLAGRVNGRGSVEDPADTNGFVSFDPKTELSESERDSVLQEMGLILFGLRPSSPHIVIASGSLEAFEHAAAHSEVNSVTVGVSKRRFDKLVFGG